MSCERELRRNCSPRSLDSKVAREFLFRTVSQITLNYRNVPLNTGAAGHVHGGDRLPWAPDGSEDNFASLSAMTWQVHVYGTATRDLRDWCGAKGLQLHVFAWRAAHDKAGLAQNALYLLRPDTYVALADPSGSPQVLERYFADQKITPGLSMGVR